MPKGMPFKREPFEPIPAPRSISFEDISDPFAAPVAEAVKKTKIRMKLGESVHDYNATMKGMEDFLYPPMPGRFQRGQVRKLPPEMLKSRYLQVLSASLGNHSMALYYCCWSPKQFQEVLDDEFQVRIDELRAQLADRATFIMHQSMGLISDRTVGGRPMPAIPPAVTSAMRQVVEKLQEKSAAAAPTAKKGRKLVIEGLDRTKTGAPPEEKRGLP